MLQYWGDMGLINLNF